MPNIVSAQWVWMQNALRHICKLHPHEDDDPCPKCMAEQHPDIRVELTEEDIRLLDGQQAMALECEKPPTVASLFSEDERWLADRVVTSSTSRP